MWRILACFSVQVQRAQALAKADTALLSPMRGRYALPRLFPAAQGRPWPRPQSPSRSLEAPPPAVKDVLACPGFALVMSGAAPQRPEP